MFLNIPNLMSKFSLSTSSLFQHHHSSLSSERCQEVYRRNQIHLMRARSISVTNISNVLINQTSNSIKNVFNSDYMLNLTPKQQVLGALANHQTSDSAEIENLEMNSIFNEIKSFFDCKTLEALSKTSLTGQKIKLQRVKAEWLEFMKDEGENLEKLIIWLEKIIVDSPLKSEKSIYDQITNQHEQAEKPDIKGLKKINAFIFSTAFLRLIHNDFITPIDKILKIKITSDLLNNEVTLKKLAFFGNEHKLNRYEKHYKFLEDFFKKTWL